MRVVERNSGFTLIELLVTLTVLAIMLAFGLPAFSTLIENNRVTSESNTLLTSINLARTEAVKRGQQVSIQSEPAGFGAGYCVIAGGLDGCQNARDNGLMIREVPAPDAVVVSDNGLAGVTFDGRGYRAIPVPAANARIEFEPGTCTAGDTRGRAISVSPVGRASVRQATCN